MNKPHKHAAVIKAWADGAAIQYKSSRTGAWFDLTVAHPSFPVDCEMRVKPEKKKCWVRIVKSKYVKSKYKEDFVSSATAKSQEEKDKIEKAFSSASDWIFLSDWIEVEYEDV